MQQNVHPCSKWRRRISQQ